MSWVCEDCEDTVLFEESACSCDTWDRDRLIEHIARLNRRIRELKRKLEADTCDDCGRRDGHDAS
jgi:hypothetical protein